MIQPGKDLTGKYSDDMNYPGRFLPPKCLPVKYLPATGTRIVTCCIKKGYFWY